MTHRAAADRRATKRRKALPKPEKCERTGKVRWPDAKAAVEVLHQAKNSATRAADAGLPSRRNEVRHYECHFCKGFHTTSQEQYAPQFAFAC